MNGSLDDREMHVFAREDYHYILVSASPLGDRRDAAVWYSPACGMTGSEIAAEMRCMADLVESTRP